MLEFGAAMNVAVGNTPKRISHPVSYDSGPSKTEVD